MFSKGEIRRGIDEVPRFPSIFLSSLHEHLSNKEIQKDWFVEELKTQSATKAAGASVGIVFRVMPKARDHIFKSELFEKSVVAPREDDPASISRFINSTWVSCGLLQLLYIKRVERRGDRWSGHVAFPGGKMEQGESFKEAAIREVQEEVGLDLNDKKSFCCLGRLRDRNIFHSRKTMVISAFIFLQVTPKEVPMTLQDTEVAYAKWIDCKELVTSSHFVQYLITPDQLKSTAMKNIFNYLKWKGLSWPAITLPLAEEAQRESDGSAMLSPNNTNSLFSDPLLSDDLNPLPDFNLWGLTMGFTLEVLTLAGFALEFQSRKRKYVQDTIAKKQVTTQTEEDDDNNKFTQTTMMDGLDSVDTKTSELRKYHEEFSEFCHVPVLVGSNFLIFNWLVRFFWRLNRHSKHKFFFLCFVCFGTTFFAVFLLLLKKLKS